MFDLNLICHRIRAPDFEKEIMKKNGTELLERIREIRRNQCLLSGSESAVSQEFEFLINSEDSETIRKILLHRDEDSVSKLLERYSKWKHDELWLESLALYRIVAKRLCEAGLFALESRDSYEEHDYTYRLIANDLYRIIKADSSNLRQQSSTVQNPDHLSDKFNYSHEMKLLKPGAFHKGLEARIGLPATAGIKDMMEREHADDLSIGDLCPKDEWDIVIHGRKGKRKWSQSTREIQSGIEHYIEEAEKFFQKCVRGNQDRFNRECCSGSLQEDAYRLTEPEIIGLRLWTGPMHKRYAGLLRCDDPNKCNVRYTTTLHAINSGISKLARLWKLPEGRKVYRGYSGMTVPDSFLERDEFGCSGGVEPSVLATTTKWETAVQYSRFNKQKANGDQNQGIIFEIEVGQVDRGADISWLSQYPREEEVLFNALSNLEVIKEPFSKFTGAGSKPIVVYPVRINGNLKSKTLEEFSDMRKLLHLHLLEHLEGEANRHLREQMRENNKNDMPFASKAVADQGTSESASNETAFNDKVLALISQRWEKLKERHEKYPIDHFNDGREEYLNLVQEAVQFKPRAERLIFISISQLCQQGDSCCIICFITLHPHNIIFKQLCVRKRKRFLSRPACWKIWLPFKP
jgi:hypothetical protein